MVRAERAGQEPLQAHPVQAGKGRAEGLPVPAGVRRRGHRAAVAAVAVDEAGRLGRHLGQGVTQAQVPEHTHAVGRQSHGRADLFQLG